MTDSDLRLLDRIEQLWNLAPEKRGIAHRDLPYYRNPGVTAESVLKDLYEHFPAPAIQSQISAFLHKISEKYTDGLLPEPREMFLAGCCLILVTTTPGIPLPEDLVRKIIRSFMSIIWYRPVEDLITRYLYQSDVLQILQGGLTAQNVTDVRLSCLEGFRLYRGLGRKDPSSDRIKRILGEIDRSLSVLQQDQDPVIRDTASRARKSLTTYER
jgi:hypothetical protein